MLDGLLDDPSDDPRALTFQVTALLESFLRRDLSRKPTIRNRAYGQGHEHGRVGGSDAGISAALRAREIDPAAEVTVIAADAYPNFSICGIPYYTSGEVTDWRNLAHRTRADLEAAGMGLRLDTTARRIDVPVADLGDSGVHRSSLPMRRTA